MTEQAKHYTKGVQEPWFSLIKTGQKTIEGRLNKGDFAQMQSGDTVTWTCGSQPPVVTKIKAIYHHVTFATYLKARTLRACLPGVKTISEGVQIYHSFYSRADEKKYGVLAIELMVV